MVFSSLEFLFLFLPVVLAGYFILPRLARNGWLLISSLLFYAWGEPSFVFLMMASIAFNFTVALGLDPESVRNGRIRKALFVLGLSGNVLFLGVYKYLNFITAVLRDWFPFLRGAIPQTSILLPIGISFFTFQAISYIVDVYRGTVRVQRNPVRLALYIALFPQLIAGPIVRYSTVCEQIASRRETWHGFTEGLYRFVIGLNKKVLLANTLAEVANRAFADGAVPDVGTAWMGAVAFSLQVYFDFGGYSDMAIGLGRIFGFTFPENFRYPYMASTVSDFWRRWHISLSTWFRDYVYFPLGGSRVGTLRLSFNILAVWTLVGIWHGADWTFIVWGFLFGLMLLAEKLTGIEGRLATGGFFPRIAYRAFTLLVITVFSLFIRAENMTQMTGVLSALVGCGSDAIPGQFSYALGECACPMAVGLLASTPLFGWMGCGGWVACICQMAFLVFSVSSLVISGYNPFLYFNF